jgi:hypothetical protein
VAEEIVPPTNKKSLYETLVIMILNDEEFEYDYKSCRTQIRGLQLAISKIISDHPNAEIIYTIEPTPNVANMFNRFKETYCKNIGRGKKKVLKKITCRYNYIKLEGDTTHEQMIEYLEEIKNENLDMIEIE